MNGSRSDDSRDGTNSLVAQQLARWDFIPHVVADVFGTSDGAEIERTLDGFCVDSLGSAVEAHEFFAASVASVHGVRLADGRRVIVKARRAGTSVDFLAATQHVQEHLARDGFPCPTPLVAPAPLGAGVATAESNLDTGERGDPHEPELRRAMAVALAQLVELCRPFAANTALERSPEVREGMLWPEPHDARFDFERTTHGSEWIDAIAVRAREQLSRESAPVVGHRDWRAENMRFTSAGVVAVYDWDSLGVLPEPELVGGAAHYFTSDFRVEHRRQLPSLEEALAFVAEYAAARGVAFSEAEERTARAALVNAMAYTARCEHSDALTDFGRHAATNPAREAFPPGSARAFLVRHARELL